MSGRSIGPEATVVDLEAYAYAAEQVATTDGRVPGERGRQTRQRLLDATVELLATTSWRSVKVTDIARQAQTSPATFYQYFANVEQAIQVLAEGMVDQAGQLADLVGGDWSESASWDTALTVTEGFLGYWEDNRAVFRVVDLATEEGEGRLRGIRVRALNAVTVALAQVIATASPSPDGAGITCSPAGSDPMAVAGTLVAMFASVSAHRYGFEFWGIRTRNLIDTQARTLHWAVTGRLAPPPPPAETSSRESTRPRTGPALGGATARRRAT
jgi:AcrR family transcriptional regulator